MNMKNASVITNLNYQISLVAIGLYMSVRNTMLNLRMVKHFATFPTLVPAPDLMNGEN